MAVNQQLSQQHRELNSQDRPSSAWRSAVALFVALTMLLAACGQDRFDNVSDTAGDATSDAEPISDAAGNAMDAVEAEVAMEDSGEVLTTEESADSDNDAPAAQNDSQTASSGQTPPTRTAAQRGREIIYTASVSVGVDDVEEAGAQAAQIIEDVGGFISSQNTTGGAEPFSSITFKVDPENFSVALERLAGIGELRNQTVSTDDVTERVVDLQSRIDVTQLGVDRLREAMANAADLEDFARLEALLLSRESDLEVMRGTLRTLRDRIDLATITLTLEQDRVNNLIAFGITVYEGHDKGIGCPGTRVDQQIFEPGDEVTLCFDVRNDGDQTLTNIAISETVLEIEGTDQLIPIFGDPNSLRPGQSLLQGYEITVERDRSLRASVTALPTDGVTSDAVGPAVRSATTPVIRVNEDAVDPGFGDGFGAATSLLTALWVATTVIAGFLLPMLIVLIPLGILGWFLMRKLRARRLERFERQEARRIANQPPPPMQRETVPAAQEESGSDESE